MSKKTTRKIEKGEDKEESITQTERRKIIIITINNASATLSLHRVGASNVFLFSNLIETTEGVMD